MKISYYNQSHSHCGDSGALVNWKPCCQLLLCSHLRGAAFREKLKGGSVYAAFGTLKTTDKHITPEENWDM